MRIIAIYFFILINTSQLPALAETNQDNNETNPALKYSIRYGIGGFSESRSPEGALGGGQIAFDVHLTDLPLSFSISQESYTNSSDPTHPYEIARSISASVFYYNDLNNMDKVSYFLGLGAGKLNVPRSETSPKPYVSDSYINIASRIHYKISTHFNLYALIKHLSAEKSVNNVKIIDYNDTIFLFGIGYDFQI